MATIRCFGARGMRPAQGLAASKFQSYPTRRMLERDFFPAVSGKNNDFGLQCAGWPFNNRPLAWLSMGKGFI